MSAMMRIIFCLLIVLDILVGCSFANLDGSRLELPKEPAETFVEYANRAKRRFVVRVPYVKNPNSNQLSRIFRSQMLLNQKKTPSFDEAAVTAAEVADRNIREICAKNARGVGEPSTSQNPVSLNDESKKINGKPSTESKDQPSRSLFDLFHSAVVNTFYFLTGGYYGTNAESDSEHDTTPIRDSPSIPLDNTDRKVQFISSVKKCDKIPTENCYRREDNEAYSLDAASMEEVQQKEAIQEVFYKIRAMKDNIAEANKVLNNTKTFSVEETMDSAFAIYESAVENLKETTKEAKNSAALLLNRLREDGKSDDGKIEKDCTESVPSVELAVRHYSNIEDEEVASKGDNPYKETLARLERATIQVKDIAKNMLDRQQKDDLNDDDEAFHEQVHRLHMHSEEMMHKALEKVAGLQSDVKESLLKSVHAYDSNRLANIAQGTSKPAECTADVEEEIEVESVSTVNSIEEEILSDDEDVEIVDEEIAQSDSDKHPSPHQKLDDDNVEDD